MDRLTPTRRPARKALGLQRWRLLLFSHWEVPREALRPLVDSRLELDDFHGRCFVGVVPFKMEGVQPLKFAPPVPTAERFGEINLRTYVHHQGSGPGVLFFSLDAGSTLAVLGARASLNLPYYRSDTTCEEEGARVRWTSTRRWPQPLPVEFQAGYEIGPALSPPEPGSLEYFLLERYLLYSTWGPWLTRVQVHHTPYPIQAAAVDQLSPALLHAIGLPSDGPRTADFFSPGVDVEIFGPERVG